MAKATVLTTKVQYRLFFVEDWQRYEQHMSLGHFSHKEMLEKLCDFSIQRLYNYCNRQLHGHNFSKPCYYELRQQVLKELFEREILLDTIVSENNDIPLAPLYRYSHEIWLNHPSELFFQSF